MARDHQARIPTTRRRHVFQRVDADVADALEDGSVDERGEIDAGLRERHVAPQILVAFRVERHERGGGAERVELDGGSYHFRLFYGERRFARADGDRLEAELEGGGRGE